VDTLQDKNPKKQNTKISNKLAFLYVILGLLAFVLLFIDIIMEDAVEFRYQAGAWLLLLIIMYYALPSRDDPIANSSSEERPG